MFVKGEKLYVGIISWVELFSANKSKDSFSAILGYYYT